MFNTPYWLRDLTAAMLAWTPSRYVCVRLSHDRKRLHICPSHMEHYEWWFEHKIEPINIDYTLDSPRVDFQGKERRYRSQELFVGNFLRLSDPSIWPGYIKKVIDDMMDDDEFNCPPVPFPHLHMDYMIGTRPHSMTSSEVEQWVLAGLNQFAALGVHRNLKHGWAPYGKDLS